MSKFCHFSLGHLVRDAPQYQFWEMWCEFVYWRRDNETKMVDVVRMLDITKVQGEFVCWRRGEDNETKMMDVVRMLDIAKVQGDFVCWRRGGARS